MAREKPTIFESIHEKLYEKISGRTQKGDEMMVYAQKLLKAQMKDEKSAIREYGILHKKADLKGEKALFKGIQADEKRHLGLLRKVYKG